MDDDESTRTGEGTERKELYDVHGFPERVLHTYTRLWQLEIWLRNLVYVECRAFLGDDWAEGLQVQRFRGADERLTHMPTPEENALSYILFPKLCGIIDSKWQLFESYLPPKSIWDARLEEVTQVRNRVAHFRRGHEDDLRRVVQLLRDVDKGFWRFCTSYNDPAPVLPYSRDAVVAHFSHLDQFPWREVQSGQWARTGMADPDARVSCTIEVLTRPWTDRSLPIAGSPGRIYDLRLRVRGSGHLDYPELLTTTRAIHSRVIHICLDARAEGVRLTLPCILGSDPVIDIFERFLSACLNCLRHGPLRVRANGIQAMSETMPEHVLGPEHLLSYLGPDMPCSFFRA